MKALRRYSALIIGILLTLGCLRASMWQWDRHLVKAAANENIRKTIALPSINFWSEIAAGKSCEDLYFRRVDFSGNADFLHEMVLRNRRSSSGEAGVFLVTPFSLKEELPSILVNRGFLPLGLSQREDRSQFQRDLNEQNIVGLVRPAMPTRPYGPQDLPAGPPHPWRDSWLRINPEAMMPQLPYRLLPCFIELTGSTNPELIYQGLLEKKSGRDELLMMAGRDVSAKPAVVDLAALPTPTHVLLPADIHRGYVVEWIFIAVFVLLASAVVQLRHNLRRRLK